MASCAKYYHFGIVNDICFSDLFANVYGKRLRTISYSCVQFEVVSGVCVLAEQPRPFRKDARERRRIFGTLPLKCFRIAFVISFSPNYLILLLFLKKFLLRTMEFRRLAANMCFLVSPSVNGLKCLM